MADDIKNESVGTTGSSDNLINTDPVFNTDAGESGEEGKARTNNDGNDSDSHSKNYEELQKKIGSQGEELGEYRKFFKDIQPLLDKLDDSPDLVQAILDGKIDSTLIEAVASGKVSISDAQVVTEAKEGVKKDMGTKAFDKASSDDIEKRISEKLQSFEAKVKKDLSEAESLREYEKKISHFIDSTPDFAEYAQLVDQWLEHHPNQDDIEVAYKVVKGESLLKEADNLRNAENAKNLAANAGGGQSQQSGSLGGSSVVDSLISGKSNPNAF